MYNMLSYRKQIHYVLLCFLSMKLSRFLHTKLALVVVSQPSILKRITPQSITHVWPSQRFQLLRQIHAMALCSSRISVDRGRKGRLEKGHSQPGKPDKKREVVEYLKTNSTQRQCSSTEPKYTSMMTKPPVCNSSGMFAYTLWLFIYFTLMATLLAKHKQPRLKHRYECISHEMLSHQRLIAEGAHLIYFGLNAYICSSHALICQFTPSYLMSLAPCLHHARCNFISGF